MQYNQNQSFCGSGYPTQSCGLINPTSPYTAQCPEVIGEGEVAQVVLPDGKTQLYFQPTKCPPLSFNHNIGNCNNSYWNSNSGVYFIRSVSNPIPYSMFQQNPISWDALFPKPSWWYTCCSNSPEYPIKFHNDCWTSTTDLRYFFPRFRTSDVLPRTYAAAVQVSVPMETHTVEMVCDKPCLCAPDCGTKLEADKSTCNEMPESKGTESSRLNGKKEREHEYRSDSEPYKSKRRTSQNRNERRKTCRCVTSRSVESENSCKSCMSTEKTNLKGNASKDKGKKHRRRYCERYTTDSEQTGSSGMEDGTNKKATSEGGKR